MRKTACALRWFDDLVSKITLAACGCLLSVMVIIEGLGVIFRFVLHDSLSWSDELSGYLFVWLTCLGAAAGVKLRAHPEVKVLANRFPTGAKKILADATDCTVLMLGIVFVLYGSDMLNLIGTETASSIEVSMYYPYLSIPVCGALLIFHSTVRIALAHLVPEDRADPALLPAFSEHI